MKSNAYYLLGCMLAWLLCSANQGWTAPLPISGSLTASGWVLGQAPSGMTAERREADRLLRAARSAIQRGDLATAEQLIAQADRLAVNYDPLYERFQDTPAKAMQALRQAQAAGVRTAATQPVAGVPRSVDQQLSMMTRDARGQAAAYLEKGRMALQQGDITGAIAWRLKAISTGATFGPGEYSPQMLAMELQQAGVPPQQLAVPSQSLPAMPLGTPDDFAQADQLQGALPGNTSTQNLRNSAFQGSLVESPYDVAPARGTMPAANGGESLYGSPIGQPQRLPSGIADNAYGAPTPRPSAQTPAPRSDVQFAYGATPDLPNQPYAVQQGVYDPRRDRSQNVMAQATELVPGPAAPQPNINTPPTPNATPGVSPGYDLYQRGVRALENQDRSAALDFFSQAWQYEGQLDPGARQMLRDKLTLLRVASPSTVSPQPGNVLEEVDSAQQLVRQKMFREIMQEQSAAEKMRETDPRGSLGRLQRLRERVEQEALDPPSRRQLLTLVDRSIREAEMYIDQNLSDIERNERNTAIVDSINRERDVKLDIQNKVAELVEQFNDLQEEERYSEAEVLAKQARELDPTNATVQLMLLNSAMASRVAEAERIHAAKEEGMLYAFNSVDESSTPYDDREPITFGDARSWVDMAERRNALTRGADARMTAAELQIREALKTKVEVRFQQRPLAEVMEALGAMSGVNVYLDPTGLSAEGVTTDEPVEINLTQPISLKSALSLILEPLHLSYVIENEVLRVTSEQTRDSQVLPRVYNVADLVIPIPNFVPSYNIGLPGALHEAINSLGYGRNFGQTVEPVGLTVPANDAFGHNMTNASVLAQMDSAGILPGVSPRSAQPFGGAPGSMGGGTMADFDTLIQLITSTIAPQTWDAVGGPGSIEGFPTNLSLVISQTQDVHEQIADLLDQLRRLQDLQVTIEVRFITLNDRFFERIGVDFDFDIDDNSNQIAGEPTNVPDDTGPSTAFGLDSTGAPTVDYDYSVTQGSFGSSVPQFGGFDAATAANFGFAILSDIEVFFLLQAAQGDNRTNVLQAPKVTLFNGQTGFVSDTSQRPFVTSVVPVVGDFAAAHQPVVVVLSEGTSLSVQAVVSPDRRFVRLTLIPFFSSIGDVDTFTFHGEETSDSGTVVQDPTNEEANVTNNQATRRVGTTVQLPTFNFTTVSTTVSVPDGGTVLLGGIKRLSEGRNERGVPMLNKIPYVSRLFKNVGIGRDTQSLMMMVTPRIIIQEEEEFLQTGYDSSEQ